MSRETHEKLGEYLANNEGEALADYLDTLTVGETGRALAQMSEVDQQALLTLLPADEAADVLERLPDAQAADLLSDLDPTSAAHILSEMSSSDQADLLGDVNEEDANAILEQMPVAEAAQVRQLRDYDQNECGSIMGTELICFDERVTFEAALRDLRHRVEGYHDSQVLYIYVSRGDRVLAGVIPLRRLLSSPPEARLGEAMLPAISVSDHLPLRELRERFAAHRFLALPVVDDDGRLVGLVQRSELEHALAERAQRSWRLTLGIVGGDELRSLPSLVRSRRRLSWLSVNVVLNLIAASVIALYQDTISAVIALAVFLPIISDMSGCSGNQAVAVSLRELSLGVVRPADLWFVLRKELAVGVLNGIVLGALLGAVAWLWQGNAALGLVVGAALALNTVVSVSIGGTVPLALRRAGVDPALASGPVLTTITDMLGFFLTLSFATLLLSRIVEG